MRTLALAMLVIVAACNKHCPAPWHPGTGHDLLASIRRTACLGWCPVYKLAIYRDGAVEYEGESHVKLVGRASGHLAPDQLAALDDLFQKRGYLELDDSYVQSVTDLPSTYTAYSPGGCSKSIEHHGWEAPKVLDAIEEGIDRIAGVEQWIGTEAERKALFEHRRLPGASNR